MKTRRVAKKCFLTFSLTLLVICSLLAPGAAFAHTSLDSTQINIRFSQIDSTYEIGDALSEEDAAFVLAYASRADLQKNQTRAGTNINKSFTSYGVTANLSGNIWHNALAAHEWGGNLTGTITSGSTPKHMRVYAHVQAFGVAADGTVSLGYSKTLDNDSYNSKSVRMNQSSSYSGFFPLSYVTSGLEVTTASGDKFSFEGDW